MGLTTVAELGFLAVAAPRAADQEHGGIL
jgi:hypothetical protein